MEVYHGYIGTRIKAAREMKGLAVQQLCELTGILAKNISGFENDRYVPFFSDLISIGRVLECSVDWFLTGSALGAPKAEHELSCDDIVTTVEKR